LSVAQGFANNIQSGDVGEGAGGGLSVGDVAGVVEEADENLGGDFLGAGALCGAPERLSP